MPEGIELEGMVLDQVRQISARNGGSDVEVGLDTNLIEMAVLDSVDFLELIAFIEKKTAQRIDLMQVDPTELVTIKGLSGHVKRLLSA